MNEPLLTHQQIFTLKPETLETRIMTYYQETQNSSLTIKYIMALRIRFRLGAQEFANICQWRNKNAVLWRFKNVVFRR